MSIFQKAQQSLISRFQSTTNWKVIIPASSPCIGAPSKSSSYDFCHVEFSPSRQFVLNYLRPEMEAIFDNWSHSETFWDDQLANILTMIGGRLIDVSILDETDIHYETEVKIALLTPLLRSIAQSASVLPEKDGGAVSSFKTLFNVESVTEQRVHIPGTKPSVDYLIKGVESSGVNNCKYLIPVEGKGLLKLKHCQQLASYV